MNLEEYKRLIKKIAEIKEKRESSKGNKTIEDYLEAFQNGLVWCRDNL